jgi:predicted alpha-1,2-mannosidase
MFMKRSESWRHLFDPKTGFIRGKKPDGSWLEPFDPVRWGDPYVEGAAWQHRWDVPHDIPALIQVLGGEEKTVSALEQMLTSAPDFNTGSYGEEIHEMSEMAAVHFGQYAHSNQPVHHVLYIFSAAGRQDRAAYWSRKVMQELYTIDSFAGDEDTGSMAAWYILSALGFFPLCPAKPEYLLGKALFPRATVHLPGGKTLIIENAAKETHATTTWLNGKLLTSSSIGHAAIVAGGHLCFS